MSSRARSPNKLGFVRKGKHRLVVIRPTDPELAVKLATDLIGKKGKGAFSEFDAIVQKQQYTYRGYLAIQRSSDSNPLSLLTGKKNGRPVVIDRNGRYVEDVCVGDSFVDERGIVGGRIDDAKHAGVVCPEGVADPKASVNKRVDIPGSIIDPIGPASMNQMFHSSKDRRRSV